MLLSYSTAEVEGGSLPSQQQTRCLQVGCDDLPSRSLNVELKLILAASAWLSDCTRDSEDFKQTGPGSLLHSVLSLPYLLPKWEVSTQRHVETLASIESVGCANERKHVLVSGGQLNSPNTVSAYMCSSANTFSFLPLVF